MIFLGAKKVVSSFYLGAKKMVSLQFGTGRDGILEKKIQSEMGKGATPHLGFRAGIGSVTPQIPGVR